MFFTLECFRILLTALFGILKEEADVILEIFRYNTDGVNVFYYGNYLVVHPTSHTLRSFAVSLFDHQLYEVMDFDKLMEEIRKHGGHYDRLKETFTIDYDREKNALEYVQLSDGVYMCTKKWGEE